VTILTGTPSLPAELQVNLSFRVDGRGADTLQVLWEDSDRALCRHLSDAEQPTVLLVVPAAEHPSPASLERLAHEFALKDELNPAWAVRPLGLKRERGRTLLVLQDPGGEPLASGSARPWRWRRPYPWRLA
jgi:hypothetical protein